MSGMTVAVFQPDGLFNRIVKILCPYQSQDRHHQLFCNQRMFFFPFKNDAADIFRRLNADHGKKCSGIPSHAFPVQSLRGYHSCGEFILLLFGNQVASLFADHIIHQFIGHAVHGHNFLLRYTGEIIIKGTSVYDIKAGFTSIMFDGSHYPIDENVAKTKELVSVAHAMGMSIEAEVGSIGGEEDGVVGMGECADPDECKRVADLGVDMLAAGIGNIHGKYPANWKGLSFETLDAIQQKTGVMPLVLHGGTGIPADMIKKAIDLGVSKINVNTECQLSFADATRKYIEAGKDLEGKGFDPRKLLAPGAEAIKATVKEKMELFGSVGKAE